MCSFLGFILSTNPIINQRFTPNGKQGATKRAMLKEEMSMTY
jgi:hypothetical protein